MSFNFPDRIEVSVTLPRDERGLTGRECPKCEKIFKVKTGTGLTEKDLPCHCPYCGHIAANNHFHTKEQVEYIRSVGVSKVREMLHNELKKLEFNHPPRGPLGIGISMKLKPHSPTPIRYYYEKNLETDVICDRCTLAYAIYGEFAFCPDCCSHNSITILKKNVEFVEKMISLAEKQEHGLAERLIGDALENLVSAFDGFGREICRVASQKSTNPTEAKDVRFQNISGAQKRLQKLFGFDFSAFFLQDEWKFVCRCFEKRHLLAHKMGVVDEDYVQTTSDHSVIVGRKIVIAATEVQRLGTLLTQLGTQISKQLLG
jgi:hypothetical protein